MPIAKNKSGPRITAPRASFRGIAQLGLSCVAIANNHLMDCGAKGFSSTVRTLDEYGMPWFGAGENSGSVRTGHQVDVNGIRIAFYAVAEWLGNAPKEDYPGVNVYDEYRVCREIRALRESSDHVIVLYHGGLESTPFCTELAQIRLRRMADAGADIVISQHTHAIGEAEYYHGAYLLYGQGNFCFHQTPSTPLTENGLLLQADMDRDSFEITCHPVKHTSAGIRLNPEYDMSEFRARSDRLSRGDTFDAEFEAHALQLRRKVFRAIRGDRFLEKVRYKLLSPDRYEDYFIRSYSLDHLLRIRQLLKNEEFWEVTVRLIDRAIEKKLRSEEQTR